MTDKAVTHVLKASPYRGGALLVHVAMAYHCDSRGEIHATPAELAVMARQSSGQVRKVLAQMLTDGRLAVIEEGSGRRATRYRIVPLVAPTSAPSGAGLVAQSASFVAPLGASTNSVTLLEPNYLQGQEQETCPAELSLTGTDLITAIFTAWQEATGHARAKLTGKRRALIKRQLKDYSGADLLAACRGIALSPFHMGDNPSSTVYDSLELVLRDASHIERFRDLWIHQGERPRADPRRHKSLGGLARALERQEVIDA